MVKRLKKQAHKPSKCVYGCACVHACINKRNIKVPRKFLLQFFPYCKIIGDFPFLPCGILSSQIFHSENESALKKKQGFCFIFPPKILSYLQQTEILGQFPQ